MSSSGRLSGTESHWQCWSRCPWHPDHVTDKVNSLLVYMALPQTSVRGRAEKVKLSYYETVSVDTSPAQADLQSGRGKQHTLGSQGQQARVMLMEPKMKTKWSQGCLSDGGLWMTGFGNGKHDWIEWDCGSSWGFHGNSGSKHNMIHMNHKPDGAVKNWPRLSQHPKAILLWGNIKTVGDN